MYTALIVNGADTLLRKVADGITDSKGRILRSGAYLLERKVTGLVIGVSQFPAYTVRTDKADGLCDVL